MHQKFGILSIVLLFNLIFCRLTAQDSFIERIEPPFWWADMNYNQVQLLVYGTDLTGVEAKAEKGISIQKIHAAENQNYLFIDLLIEPSAKPGKYTLQFLHPNKHKVSIDYELKERIVSPERAQGFDSGDAIYLLMPDRFSNGDPENDSMEGMIQGSERNNPDGRHGGDIQGIISHLDYIADMGFTALWMNPLLENNNYKESYHGYAITDFYSIDPRLGSNRDYLRLVDSAHHLNIRVINDMVFNHSSTNHWFIRDLPMDDWIHSRSDSILSNFRGETNIDPHASLYDLKMTTEGWFDHHMADLNQKNPFLFKYLVQNSIWWIEYAGIDGIRMDTYPYPDKQAMAEWAKIIGDLYPDFTILGEVWQQIPPHTAYWQDNQNNYDAYRSWVHSVTDFPTYYAVKDGLLEKEDWTRGFRRIYYVLAQDFLYSQPEMLTVFADNHDLDRFFTSIGEDLNKYKIGMTYLLTTRGIPQVYYGTEVLMTGDKSVSPGHVREDFPGGWASDTINAFTGKGLTNEQKEAQDYITGLLNWRKNTPAIQNGKLIQFIPENDLYVYFRLNHAQTVMVILNKNEQEIELRTDQYQEYLDKYKTARNVLTHEYMTGLQTITISGMSALILEMNEQDEK